MLLLDGKKASTAKLESVKEEISKIINSYAKAPKLCVIRVGSDPASEVYVKKKIKTSAEVGILSEEHHFTDIISEKELLHKIEILNADEDVDGILVQLPLPAHINTDKVLESVSPDKDVDGFHPMNLGRLVARDPRAFVACTPLGILRMLEFYDIDLKGKFAVVMGRSRIVGRPMSLLLDHAGASVCVLHSQSLQPELIARQADILVVAIGQAEKIGKDFVKEGAVVVDVGIHRSANSKLVGDVRFDEVKSKVSAISPVPGGVGPMTISSLMENCLLSFKRRHKLS